MALCLQWKVSDIQREKVLQHVNEGMHVDTVKVLHKSYRSIYNYCLQKGISEKSYFVFFHRNIMTSKQGIELIVYNFLKAVPCCLLWTTYQVYFQRNTSKYQKMFEYLPSLYFAYMKAWIWSLLILAKVSTDKLLWY